MNTFEYIIDIRTSLIVVETMQVYNIQLHM